MSVHNAKLELIKLIIWILEKVNCDSKVKMSSIVCLRDRDPYLLYTQIFSLYNRCDITHCVLLNNRENTIDRELLWLVKTMKFRLKVLLPFKLDDDKSMILHLCISFPRKVSYNSRLNTFMSRPKYSRACVFVIYFRI